MVLIVFCFCFWAREIPLLMFMVCTLLVYIRLLFTLGAAFGIYFAIQSLISITRLRCRGTLVNLLHNNDVANVHLSGPSNRMVISWST